MVFENIEVSSAIQQILKKELKNGNEIAETSKGWWSENSLLIILKLPFRRRYYWTGLTYEDSNDPHYWKAAYHDPKSKQTLACKF